MRYVCLGYHDEASWRNLSDTDRERLMEENFAYEVALRTSGHFVDAKALQNAGTATTLRFSSGKVAITDGPFAETKEQLGGLLVLEARDLNHAIQLMSNMPCMRLGGSLEIRPINEEIDGELAAARHRLRERGQNGGRENFRADVDSNGSRSTH
jgi:hypothetical protein